MPASSAQIATNKTAAFHCQKKEVFGLSYEAEASKCTTPLFSDVTTKRLTTILAYTNIAARERICLKFSLDFNGSKQTTRIHQPSSITLLFVFKIATCFGC